MTVEGLDLVSNVDGLMLANTNDSRVAMNSCCDINKDGKIQYLDLGILLAHYCFKRAVGIMLAVFIRFLVLARQLLIAVKKESVNT